MDGSARDLVGPAARNLGAHLDDLVRRDAFEAAQALQERAADSHAGKRVAEAV